MSQPQPSDVATEAASRPSPPRRRIAWLGRRSPLLDLVQVLLFVAVVVWVVLQGAAAMEYNWQWYRIPKYLYTTVDGDVSWGPLLLGLMVTLQLAAWSTLFSITIGLVTTLLRLYGSFSGRFLATIYLEAIRNTPLLVQLFIFYIVLAPILGLDRFWAGVLCLSLFEGAFAAEIIRAGIESVPRGQREAGDAIGLNSLDRFRFVVAPQAIPLILPPMTGLIISLIKHSAIVSVIAVAELTTEGLNIISETFMAFEIWFTVAAIYLSITVSLSFFVTWLEYRMSQGK